MSQYAKIRNQPVIIVCQDNRRLHELSDELNFYCDISSKIEILCLPDWECLPYDILSPHPDITSTRLRSLAELPNTKHAIFLVSLEALMQRLPPKNYLAQSTLSISPGDRINSEEFRTHLDNTGYLSVAQVMGVGEYAARGGVIDIFATGYNNPFRLDLFGSEIESIRCFDPNTQKSTKLLDHIDILPAREFPINENGISKFRENFRAKFEGDPQKQIVYQEISRHCPVAGVEFYFPLFFGTTATLFDYAPRSSLWFIEDEALEHIDSFWANINDRYTTARNRIERQPLAPELFYLSPDILRISLDNKQAITLNSKKRTRNSVVFSSELPGQFLIQTDSNYPYSQLLSHISKTKHRILLVATTETRKNVLTDLFATNNIRINDVASWSGWLDLSKSKVGITCNRLLRGIYLPNDNIEVISESQIYGDHISPKRHKNRKIDPESIIRSLTELSIGDPVVHHEHGIGRYRGLRTLGVKGQETEFLMIEYLDGDKLYVPIVSLQLISRYLGGNKDTVSLNKIGTDSWSKTKAIARQKAHDVAVELLEINALRAANKTTSFALPTNDYEAFVQRFEFETTPDQEAAMSEVIMDLELETPMDRLVCGDVGFGKTEIALRAAFLTVYNKKQVAILVPTTILAQQHFETFVRRFDHVAVEIELLSRFRQKRFVDEIVASLRDGHPDIIIGTHRILQKDIRFKELGLLIIDEEHRFGVRQKEALKRLRSEVNVLTLTATPIPRTLNTSLSGMRPISLITTPPENRQTIKTFVCEWNDDLIREACLRELHRGGQVFFLHNRVSTINSAADALAKLVPEAEMRIAHGQMPRGELERVMRDFYRQRFNILVCTTIIESGIDLPNANTIIVDRANNFGMAQLHQLRGRVGRSHHKAYAYLTKRPNEVLDANAERRLDAIASLEDLGSGFALATHDLEIRGAGELLGDAQSGMISDIGFSLYSEYLNRAIFDLSDTSDFTKIASIENDSRMPEVQLNIPTLFPETYLPDVHARLVFYKRIAGAQDANELYELQLEAIDRFGLLPEPAKFLFQATNLKLKCSAIGIRKLTLDSNGGKIEFFEDTDVDTSTLLANIAAEPSLYRMISNFSLRITTSLPESKARIEFAEQFVTKIS
ncbi:MAG: transcription-repair coupling factor [Acidiferrobacteraceae bacterium]|nr:transcription-repair coupling factor [Acidiferrobacteraceae bacterium]